MDTGALYDSVKDSFDLGMPQLISHDRHRPIGWVVPAAVYLEPGLTRVLAHVIEPETDEDLSQIKERWARFIASTIHDVPQKSITRLKELLRTGVLTESEIPWNSGAHALRGPGLAHRAFPEIFEHVDKDGLVPFTALTMIRPGIFLDWGALCVRTPFHAALGEPFQSLQRRAARDAIPNSQGFQRACESEARSGHGGIGRHSCTHDGVGLLVRAEIQRGPIVAPDRSNGTHSR